MKIEKYLLTEEVFDAIVTVEYKNKKYRLHFPVSTGNEKEAEKKAKDMVELHKKNKQFPPETKILNIDIKKG
jgi:hypothetical protein